MKMALAEQLYWPIYILGYLQFSGEKMADIGEVSRPVIGFSLASHIGQEFANIAPIRTP